MSKVDKSSRSVGLHPSDPNEVSEQIEEASVMIFQESDSGMALKDWNIVTLLFRRERGKGKEIIGQLAFFSG